MEATRLGAYDFIEKPISLAKLLLVVNRALETERLQQENLGLKRQVLQVLRATNLFEKIGEQNIFPTEDMALEAIYDWMGADASSAYCPLKPGEQAPQPA